MSCNKGYKILIITITTVIIVIIMISQGVHGLLEEKQAGLASPHRSLVLEVYLK